MGTQRIIKRPHAPRATGTRRTGALLPHERIGGSPLLTDPPAHRAGDGGMGLSILGGDDGGGQTPVLVSSGAVSVALLIGTGDPFDLTGLEVRAHREGEDHRSRLVWN